MKYYVLLEAVCDRDSLGYKGFVLKIEGRVLFFKCKLVFCIIISK